MIRQGENTKVILRKKDILIRFLRHLTSNHIDSFFYKKSLIRYLKELKEIFYRIFYEDLKKYEVFHFVFLGNIVKNISMMNRTIINYLNPVRATDRP